MQHSCPSECACTAGNTMTDCLCTEQLVAAGDVRAELDCPCAESVEYPAMAVMRFPMQTYRAGFSPCEALKAGTLFPELATTYIKGC